MAREEWTVCITAQDLDVSPRPSDEEIARWLSEFSRFVETGQPILSALKTLALCTPNLRLKALSLEIDAEIKEGECISTAVSGFKWLSLESEAQLIDIGEEIGELDRTLAKAAELRLGQFTVPEGSPVHGSGMELLFYKLLVLQHGGLPILRSLRILQRHSARSPKGNTEEELLVKVCQEIECGAVLSEAFATAGGVPQAILDGIRSGEAEGNLEVVLRSWFVS